eukprot:2500246-Amphidinium_carterae.1
MPFGAPPSEAMFAASSASVRKEQTAVRSNRSNRPRSPAQKPRDDTPEQPKGPHWPHRGKPHSRLSGQRGVQRLAARASHHPRT